MRLVEAIGKRVEKLLQQHELKQNQLASKGGMCPSTLSLIVRVKRNEIGVGTIYQICDTLGITLKDFFDDPIFAEVND